MSERTPVQRLRAVAYDAIRDALEDTDAFRTCVHCTHFDEQRELCKLAGQRPPARVIVFGCDSFVDAEGDNVPPDIEVGVPNDDIPF